MDDKIVTALCTTVNQIFGADFLDESELRVILNAIQAHGMHSNATCAPYQKYALIQERYALLDLKRLRTAEEEARLDTLDAAIEAQLPVYQRSREVHEAMRFLRETAALLKKKARQKEGEA